MNKRKRYTSEFKREAVRLMGSSEKPASDVARQLGEKMGSEDFFIDDVQIRQ